MLSRLFGPKSALINVYGNTLRISLFKGNEQVALHTVTCDPDLLTEGISYNPAALLKLVVAFFNQQKFKPAACFINAPFFASCASEKVNFYLLNLLLACKNAKLPIKRIVIIDIPSLLKAASSQQLRTIAESKNLLGRLAPVNLNPRIWLLMITAALGLGFATGASLWLQHVPIVSLPTPIPTLQRSAANQRSKAPLQRTQQILQLLTTATPPGVVIEELRQPQSTTNPPHGRKRDQASSAHTGQRPTQSLQLQGLSIDTASVIQLQHTLQTSQATNKSHLSTLTILPDKEIAAHANTPNPYRYRFVIDL